MTPSISLQIPLAPAIVAPTEHEDRETRLARGEATDARWFVLVVLTVCADRAVRAVRVIINDRDTQRIVLHTVWTDWRDVPLLTLPLGTLSSLSPLSLPTGTPETMAVDLATALVASLTYNADACLEQLGEPIGSLPAQMPGPQERAALRNTRDAAMA